MKRRAFLRLLPLPAGLLAFGCTNVDETNSIQEPAEVPRAVPEVEGSAAGQTLTGTTEERLRTLIVEQMGVDPDQVALEARFVDDLGMDSLDAVELIMAVEESFDLEIPDEDAMEIVTVRQAVEYIERRSGG